MAVEDLGILEPLLERRGFRVRYVDTPVHGVEDRDVIHSDLVVVLGGPVGAGATTAYPFLEAETDALAVRVADGAPTLGICLGAQLMVRALGGQIKPAARHEIGYAPLLLTPAGQDSPLAELDHSLVLHWHGDEFVLPRTSAVLNLLAGSCGAPAILARTPACPQQAFAIGRTLLGLQFHVETDWRRIEGWLVGHACELRHAGIDPRTIRSDAARLGPGLEQAARRCVGRWLDSIFGP